MKRHPFDLALVSIPKGKLLWSYHRTRANRSSIWLCPVAKYSRQGWIDNSHRRRRFLLGRAKPSTQQRRDENFVIM